MVPFTVKSLPISISLWVTLQRNTFTWDNWYNIIFLGGIFKYKFNHTLLFEVLVFGNDDIGHYFLNKFVVARSCTPMKSMKFGGFKQWTNSLCLLSTALPSFLSFPVTWQINIFKWDNQYKIKKNWYDYIYRIFPITLIKITNDFNRAIFPQKLFSVKLL